MATVVFSRDTQWDTTKYPSDIMRLIFLQSKIGRLYTPGNAHGKGLYWNWVSAYLALPHTDPNNSC
jgi:hypothetical protein